MTYNKNTIRDLFHCAKIDPLCSAFQLLPTYHEQWIVEQWTISTGSFVGHFVPFVEIREPYCP